MGDYQAVERATSSSIPSSNTIDAAPVQPITTHAPSRLCRRTDISLHEDDDPENELNADGSSRIKKKRPKVTREPLGPKANARGGRGGGVSGGSRRGRGRGRGQGRAGNSKP
jgi:hypothetical protein